MAFFLPPKIDADWTTPPRAARWTIGVCAAIALGVCGYLAITALRSDTVVGCGQAFDCEHVLSTRWSKWFGLPVSLPAAAIHVSILASLLVVCLPVRRNLRWAAWNVLLVLALAAGSAAWWFVGLLVFVVKGICLYCLIAHACAFLIATAALVGQFRIGGRALAPACIGVGMLGVVVLGQWASKASKSYDIERTAESETEENPLVLGQLTKDGDERPLVDDGSDTPHVEPSEVPSRLISVLSGRVKIDAYQQPILGSPEAPHVLVALFDYTCHHCRLMHHHLAAARRRYGDQLAVLLVPVPMNANCNPRIAVTHPDHTYACELARLALVVWNVAPEKFEEFDTWLFEPEISRTAAEARSRAAQLIGAESVEKGLADWKTSQQLRRSVELYDGGVIPKLLFPQIVLRGRIDTAQELFDVLEYELKLRP